MALRLNDGLRNKPLATNVTPEFQQAFRRAANHRRITVADLLREAAEPFVQEQVEREEKEKGGG